MCKLAISASRSTVMFVVLAMSFDTFAGIEYKSDISTEAVKVPYTSFTYKGRFYEIEEQTVLVRVKKKSLGDGKFGRYERAGNGYEISLNSNVDYYSDSDSSLRKAWHWFRHHGGDYSAYSLEKSLVHETTHLLVDRKYCGDFSDAEYGFVHEMMAHMSEGLSDLDALRRVYDNYPDLKELAIEYAHDQDMQLCLTEEAYARADQVAKDTFVPQTSSVDKSLTYEESEPAAKWMCPGCAECEQALIKGYLGEGYDIIAPVDSSDGHYHAVRKGE